MTNSMKNLLKDCEQSSSAVKANKLISLNVIDVNAFIDALVENKNPKLFYIAAKDIKNIPIFTLVNALVEMPLSDFDEKYRWKNLSRIALEIKNAPFNEIADIIIEKSYYCPNATYQLLCFLPKYQDRKKIVFAIANNGDYYVIDEALEILNYNDEDLINSLLNFKEDSFELFDSLLKTIANCDLVYIPKIVMRMNQIFPNNYLLALLKPKTLDRIKESLGDEAIKNNSNYLKILFTCLSKEIPIIKESPDPYKYLGSISSYHHHLFSTIYDGPVNNIFNIADDIIMQISNNNTFITSLSEIERFEHLMGLCKDGNFSIIRNNLEVFQNLFQESSTSSIDDSETKPKIYTKKSC